MAIETTRSSGNEGGSAVRVASAAPAQACLLPFPHLVPFPPLLLRLHNLALPPPSLLPQPGERRQGTSNLMQARRRRGGPGHPGQRMICIEPFCGAWKVALSSGRPNAVGGLTRDAGPQGRFCAEPCRPKLVGGLSVAAYRRRASANIQIAAVGALANRRVQSTGGGGGGTTACVRQSSAAHTFSAG